MASGYLVLPYMTPILLDPLDTPLNCIELQNTNLRSVNLYYKDSIDDFDELLLNIRTWFQFKYNDSIRITEPTYFLNINKTNIAIPYRNCPCCNPDKDTPPIISIVGDDTVCVCLGEPYSDDGATAFDAETGVDISDRIITESGSIDTGKVGTYHVKYTVVDDKGTMSMKTRTVYVHICGFEYEFDYMLDADCEDIKKDKIPCDNFFGHGYDFDYGLC